MAQIQRAEEIKPAARHPCLRPGAFRFAQGARTRLARRAVRGAKRAAGLETLARLPQAWGAPAA